MTEQNGLERSSATDELRRLLDERGVEWTEPNNKARSHTTYWTAGFLSCIAVEFNDGMVSIASSSDDITPEQAVEATLGSDLKAENEQLQDENERLQDENERLRSCLSDSAENSKQIMHEAHVQEEENAKLRELAKEACELARVFYYCGGTFNDLDDLLCEASELGIEVEG